MKCEVCQRDVHEAKSLFRINDKGVSGIYRCETHPPNPGQCCCSYLLDKMCGWHQHELLGKDDVVSVLADPSRWA